ncbi:MAG: guanitoxin biosynthesis heme-dependent pre-guanitoxin N-hydroxylase GntA [Bdellovibrionota bacterium]
MSALQLEAQSASERLFFPVGGVLQPALTYLSANKVFRQDREKTEADLSALMAQKNYPCVAALQSYKRDDYFVGFYDQIGTGTSWRDLRNDLGHFLSHQFQSNSVYLTFWALFPEQEALDEETFEQKMWRELSFLTSHEDKNSDWKPGATMNPEDKSFCFHLFGEAFFVVGLHPHSSRKGRKFSRPALVFNVFRQFEKLMNENHYDPMVKVNRMRDEKFQGSANPMVLAHGENWETIQFSGKKNSSSWKCPFRFLSSSAKP